MGDREPSLRFPLNDGTSAASLSNALDTGHRSSRVHLWAMDRIKKGLLKCCDVRSHILIRWSAQRLATLLKWLQPP
jgi:hypothetical protein